MTLTTETRNGWAYVKNISSDGAEEPLAPEGSWRKVGDHYLGIQRPYQNPVLVRAYFDPSNVPGLDRYEYLGYVQFLRIRVAGRIVLPSVFGGSYTAQADYASELRGGTFVDFMGLGDARIRMAETDAVMLPMYAFNSMLWTDSNTIDALSTVGPGTTNGTLYQPRGGGSMSDGNGAECASLRGQINTSLVTPEILGNYTGNTPILVDKRVSKNQVAAAPLYKLAIDAIRESEKVTGDDRKITLDDISYGRFVGPDLLLNVANFENMEPVLCARLSEPDSEGYRLTIKLIDYDSAREIEEEGVRALLRRVHEYETYGVVPGQKTRKPGQGRGSARALRVEDGEELVTFEARSCVYGRLAGTSPRPTIRFISGVGYDLPFIFDAVGGGLVLGNLPEPREIRVQTTVLHNALVQYDEAFANPQLTSVVDTSNFDMIGASWVTPGTNAPPLPQRPLPFA